jgi:hypothetical protein
MAFRSFDCAGVRVGEESLVRAAWAMTATTMTTMSMSSARARPMRN